MRSKYRSTFSNPSARFLLFRVLEYSPIAIDSSYFRYIHIRRFIKIFWSVANYIANLCIPLGSKVASSRMYYQQVDVALINSDLSLTIIAGIVLCQRVLHPTVLTLLVPGDGAGRMV